MMHEICPQRPESRPPYYPFLSKILGAKGGATLRHCDIVNHWHGVNKIAIFLLLILKWRLIFT